MFGMTSTRLSDDNHGTLLGDVVIVKQTEKKCSLAVAGLILSFFYLLCSKVYIGKHNDEKISWLYVSLATSRRAALEWFYDAIQEIVMLLKNFVLLVPEGG